MGNKHILVLNLLFETSLKNSFNNRIAETFKDISANYEIVHLDDLKNIDYSKEYTHLLISGSTESAIEENTWYPQLDSIIHHFISKDKSILGICFGHQFLIRHILGKSHVRKSATPEIGWINVELSNNPIFNNIDSLKSAVFHYDEIFDLDKRFEITASSERCAIHGFQVQGQKIWGIQFHPDFMYDDVFKFTNDARKEDLQFEKNHCQTNVSKEEFAKNNQIFKNWIEIS